MNIIVKNTCEAVGRERWNSLVSQNATNTIFQTYEWHRAFEATYSGGHRGYILCGNEGDDLVGIAPLCICSIRKKHVVRFFGYERADYCDFIYRSQRSDFIAEVFSFLRSNLSEWDRIELNNIPEGSPTHGLVSDACALLHLFPSPGKKLPCPALLFKDKDRPCDAVLKNKSLVRHHKYFSKQPDFCVSHSSSGEEISPHLGAFFDQHIARWSTTAFPSLFLSRKHQEFYRNLVKELDATGWMLFTSLYSKGSPIAFHFGFVYHNKLIWYKPTFDILLSRHSPGDALLEELMRYAQRHDLNELDFTVGDEGYKRRYSNIVRYNISRDIFNSPVRYAANRIRRLTKDTINRLPSGLGRLSERIWENGIRGLPKQVVFALMLILFRRSGVILYSRSEAPQSNLEKEFSREQLQIRPGTLNDAICFFGYLPAGERHEAISATVKRFREGGTLFVALQNGTIAGIAWVFSETSIEISEVAYRMDLPDNSIVIGACVTAPEFRRKHVYRTLLQSISNSFSDKAQFIYCEEDNIASRKGIEKVFEGSRTIRMVSVCGIRFHIVKSIHGPR